MMLLSLPCELIELVCLEMDFEVLKEVFRSGVVSVLNEELFWARKAHKDSGFPMASFFKRSIVEQEISIPNFLMIRYVEVVSRKGVVSDSSLFLSERECLRRAAKNRNVELIAYFKSCFRRNFYYCSKAIFDQALRDNNKELFEPLIESHRSSSFDFLLGLRHIPIPPPRQSIEHKLGWICGSPCQTLDGLRNLVLDVGRDVAEIDRDMILHCALVYHNRLDLLRQLDYTDHESNIWEMVGRISSIELYQSIVALFPFDDTEGPDPDRDVILLTALETGNLEFIKEVATLNLLPNSDELASILFSPVCLELMEYVSGNIGYRDQLFGGCSVSLDDVNKIASLAVKKLIFRLKDIRV